MCVGVAGGGGSVQAAGDPGSVGEGEEVVDARGVGLGLDVGGEALVGGDQEVFE